MFAEPLDVRHEVPGGVGAEIRSGVTGVRRATTRPPLVVEDQAIAARREHRGHPAAGSGTGTTVQGTSWSSIWVPVLFPEEDLSVTDGQATGLPWLARRVAH